MFTHTDTYSPTLEPHILTLAHTHTVPHTLTHSRTLKLTHARTVGAQPD